ncbi:hypothetical protein [Tenacibaculum agarivorans]|uniref:hypothetical protein n=1 Tax=Tenacibaculum agarivorans TaxID=1908389 RepID=UPI00094BB349|nr:hypothetical protein [Tenacibaculum agarivorans]
MDYLTNIKLSEFQSEVKTSISLIGNLKESLEDEKLSSFLSQNGIKKSNAIEIVIFLPIAFVRKMLPNVNWPENYIEQLSDKKQRTKSFAENGFYKIIKKETDNYYAGKAESEVILKIAGRSAEFKVINDLLFKNEKADISKIKLTENIIIRNE